MNSGLKIVTGDPGEALIIIENRADAKGQGLNVAFPQFPSIPVQPVLRQEIQGNDLVLVIDGDSLGDILEGGSPCQIKIPELELSGIVTWPMIVGKRSINKKQSVPSSVNPSHFGQVQQEEIEQRSDDEVQPMLSEEDTNINVNTSPRERLYTPIDDHVSVSSDRDQEEDLLIERPVQKKKRNSSFLLWFVLGFIIIVLGVIIKNLHGYYDIFNFLSAPSVTQQDKSNKASKSNTTENKPVVKDQEVAPSLPQIQDMSVNDVIAKAPNAVIITQEGKRRLLNHQADDGVLLLENAASKGDKDAMLELGRLYNPVDFKSGGPIPSPDMREAARYFQKAVQSGSQEAVAPRDALHSWLMQQADKGDEMARLTLKDFW